MRIIDSACLDEPKNATFLLPDMTMPFRAKMKATRIGSCRAKNMKDKILVMIVRTFALSLPNSEKPAYAIVFARDQSSIDILRPFTTYIFRLC